MIGIAENNLGADVFDLRHGRAFNRTVRGAKDKVRRLDAPVRRLDACTMRPTR